MNTRRIKQTHFTFADARTKLSDQIDALSGEDLAEALAEVDGADKGTFNPANGQVTIEKEVFIPHFSLNKQGIILVNEEGCELPIDFLAGMENVSPRAFACEILNHIGVDIPA